MDMSPADILSRVVEYGMAEIEADMARNGLDWTDPHIVDFDRISERWSCRSVDLVDPSAFCRVGTQLRQPDNSLLLVSGLWYWAK